jgi:hypothetical protein
MILSQLVEADELMAMSPEELREMIVRLDDEVVHGNAEILSVEEKPEGADAAGAATDTP